MFEMNDEQEALFDKLTKLQRAMALNDIAGMKPAENHKEAGGVCKTEADRRKLASEILTNPDVAAFLDSMKTAIVNDAIMTRTEMLEGLTKLATLSAEDLKKGVELITELKGGYDVKMKAMDMISKLEGWESATKHDHSSSDGSMSPVGRKLDDFYSDSNV